MKLLIVGNLEGQLINASKIAQKNGARVFTASDSIAGLQALRGMMNPDIVMIDIKEDVVAFIEALKRERICINVIACGIDADSKRAVEAIKAGAKEFIPLPPDEVLIAAVLESIAEMGNSFQLIGSSKVFEDILKIAKQIAPSKASVLITGPSGSGKEMIAKFIHKNSTNKHLDFVCVNCAAIPENLLESELFGHEKGAFTGAIERRIGKFEQAQGSTILLDEISEMTPSLQAKLLRVLQEREVVRIGGSQTIKLDIRVIATSNRDLLREVQLGNFREDLLYRLNVIHLHLPPLSKRQDDLADLVTFFINKYAKLNGIEAKNLAQNAMLKLKAYKWPGNIRELENTIHRALLLAEGDTIRCEDIILTLDQMPANEYETLADIEKQAISHALFHNQGDQIRTAMILGITINALQEKLKAYRLTG